MLSHVSGNLFQCSASWMDLTALWIPLRRV